MEQTLGESCVSRLSWSVACRRGAGRRLSPRVACRRGVQSPARQALTRAFTRCGCHMIVARLDLLYGGSMLTWRSALQKRVWVAEQKVAVPGASHFGRSRRGSEASSVERAPGADSRCSCIAEARAVGGGAEDLCSKRERGRQRTAKRIDDAPQSLEEVVEMERSAPHEHKSHSSLRST